MKQTILASALLLAFTMTAVGQTQKNRKATPPASPKPTEWKVDGKSVWNYDDIWTLADRSGDNMCVLMPADSLKIAVNGDLAVSVVRQLETDTVRVKGNTITYRDVLINGRPMRTRYVHEYYGRYVVTTYIPFLDQVATFKRAPEERLDDFTVIAEGTVKDCEWVSAGSSERGDTVISHNTCTLEFDVKNVYVFSKTTKEAVFAFEGERYLAKNPNAKWERDLPKAAND